MSHVRKPIVSNCEKLFLLKALSESTRLDGRAFHECRSLDIQFGKDWGCCFVSLGATRVVAQVSCEIQQPNLSRPSEGLLNINLELNPIAAPHFEVGRQSEHCVQLNRLLEKCLKVSKAVDLESLCIQMNEKVWALRVDINVLNHEGNILDCASIAALAALAHFRRPDVTCDGEEFTIHEHSKRDPIPTVIHHYPVCVSYAIFNEGEFIIADPTLLEEDVSDAFLTIGINSYKEMCALHLGGKSNLSAVEVVGITEKAAARANIVVTEIKSAVQEDDSKRKSNKPIGFHTLENFGKTEITINDLATCLDEWSTVSKRKQKKLKLAQKSIETKPVITELKDGSALLVPNKNTWIILSSDEEEVDDKSLIAPTPVQSNGKAAMEIDSDGSEEEQVVVLNADKKTNKRKKK